MDEYEELMQKCVEEFKRRKELRLKRRRLDEIAQMKAYLENPGFACPSCVTIRVAFPPKPPRPSPEEKRRFGFDGF